MIKVLVLEHFPVQQSDRMARRERWLQAKAFYEPRGVSIDIPQLQLDEDGRKAGGKLLGLDGKAFAVEGYDLIFVHHSDMDRYLDNAVARAIPVVCYGGGGKELDIGRISKMVIDFLPISYLESNMNKFFDGVAINQKVTRSALDVLVGFDPTLEAKLELLHRCLTPKGARAVIEGAFSPELNAERAKFWRVNLASQCPSLVAGSVDSRVADMTVEELVKSLGSLADGFTEEYLIMLRALQHCLLHDVGVR